MYQRGYYQFARGLDVYGRLPAPQRPVNSTYESGNAFVFSAEELRTIVGLGTDDSQDSRLEELQLTAYTAVQEHLDQALGISERKDYYALLTDRMELSASVSGTVSFKVIQSDGKEVNASDTPPIVDPSSVVAAVTVPELADGVEAGSSIAAPYVLVYASGTDTEGITQPCLEIVRKMIRYEYGVSIGGEESDMARADILSQLAPYVLRD